MESNNLGCGFTQGKFRISFELLDTLCLIVVLDARISDDNVTIKHQTRTFLLILNIIS